MSDVQKEITFKEVLKDAENLKKNTQNIVNLEKEINDLEKERKALESKYIGIARKAFMRHETPFGVSDEYVVRLSFNAPNNLDSAQSAMFSYANLIDKGVGKSLLEQMQACEEKIEQRKNEIDQLTNKNRTLLESNQVYASDIDYEVTFRGYILSKWQIEALNEYRNAIYVTKYGMELGSDLMAVDLIRNIETLKSNMFDILDSQEKIAMFEEKKDFVERQCITAAKQSYMRYHMDGFSDKEVKAREAAPDTFEKAKQYFSGSRDMYYKMLMAKHQSYEKQSEEHQKKILKLQQANQSLLESHQIDVKEVCAIIDRALEKGRIEGCLADDLTEYRNLIDPTGQYREVTYDNEIDWDEIERDC